jgi:DNA excision repair protein ERCC-2
MAFFPYSPRPYQEKAVLFSTDVFSRNTVGLLSADCGVGKTIAVLSGYFAARASQPEGLLFVLTRTHSQSKVFENELEVLRTSIPDLKVTTMVSRVHLCPMKERMEALSSTGFMKACASLIRTGRCTHYWNFYTKSEGRHTIRSSARDIIDDMLEDGVVTREVLEYSAHEHSFCPYEMMRWCARESRVIVGPYSYLFRARVRDAMLSSLNTGLFDMDLLVDEAHNLSENVLDSETARLFGSEVKWLLERRDAIVKETGATWLGETIDFLWETIMLKLDEMASGDEIRLQKWDVLPRFIREDELRFLIEASHPSTGDPDAAMSTETPVDRLLDFLLTASLATKSDDWHISIQRVRTTTGDLGAPGIQLAVRPLNSAGLIAPVLRGAKSALLMSGTLRPLKHYARLLGVSGCLMCDLASPYPKGTRLVLVDKSLSTKYTERGSQLWKAIAARISAALTAMPANKTALIAFPSYSIMNEVMSYGIDQGFRGVLVETRGERLERVAEAIESEPHAVFCVYSGKFTEGIDLVQSGSSMIDLIIGVGIPFSPPTTYQKALQEWYDGRFGKGSGYYYAALIPSIRRVAQLLGRLRRSPEDWGVVVLLDRRFLRHLDAFGNDLISDIYPYRDQSELSSAIKEFVRMREALNW